MQNKEGAIFKELIFEGFDQHILLNFCLLPILMTVLSMFEPFLFGHKRDVFPVLAMFFSLLPVGFFFAFFSVGGRFSIQQLQLDPPKKNGGHSHPCFAKKCLSQKGKVGPYDRYKWSYNL